MLFSQESSQAIFDMANVELIELKTSRIQCPSCLHYVFKGTILRACGKHIRPDQEMIRRVKAAFEILKAPYFRMSVATARGYKHGTNLSQKHHHKAKDALRGTKKGGRKFTSIWDGWENDKTYRESQLAINWSDAWARYLDHIAQSTLISEVMTKIDRHHLYQQGQDKEAKTALVETQRQSRQDLGIPCIPKSERGRLRINSILHWYL